MMFVIGAATKPVAKLMHSHFLKEDEYALPPLRLLAALSQGCFEPKMDEVLRLTETLKPELPATLAEHQQIVIELRKLIAAAKAENLSEVIQFAEQLMSHAQKEEQAFYPTAILVGQLIKSRLGSKSSVLVDAVV